MKVKVLRHKSRPCKSERAKKASNLALKSQPQEREKKKTMQKKNQTCAFVEREMNGLAIFVDEEIIVPEKVGVTIFEG